MRLHAYGGPEVLRVEDVARPVTAADEMLAKDDLSSPLRVLTGQHTQQHIHDALLAKAKIVVSYQSDGERNHLPEVVE